MYWSSSSYATCWSEIIGGLALVIHRLTVCFWMPAKIWLWHLVSAFGWSFDSILLPSRWVVAQHLIQDSTLSWVSLPCIAKPASQDEQENINFCHQAQLFFPFRIHDGDTYILSIIRHRETRENSTHSQIVLDSTTHKSGSIGQGLLSLPPEFTVWLDQSNTRYPTLWRMNWTL